MGVGPRDPVVGVGRRDGALSAWGLSTRTEGSGPSFSSFPAPGPRREEPWVLGQWDPGFHTTPAPRVGWVREVPVFPFSPWGGFGG